MSLKKPAIDAVVDRVAPLEIEVDPLGETVEDKITSVDDLTEADEIELSIPSSLLTSLNSVVKSPKSLASVIVRLYDAIQNKEAIDFSKNAKVWKSFKFDKKI